MVVESNDEAVDILAIAFGHDTHEQGAAALATNQFDLILDQGLGLRSRPGQQVSHFRNCLLERVAGEVVLLRVQQRER